MNRELGSSVEGPARVARPGMSEHKPGLLEQTYYRRYPCCGRGDRTCADSIIRRPCTTANPIYPLPIYPIPANTSKHCCHALSGVSDDPVTTLQIPSHRLPGSPLSGQRSRAVSHRRSNTTLVTITFDSMPSPTYKELTSAGKLSYSVHFI